MNEVQAELSPLVLPLVPSSNDPITAADIPFMAVAVDSDWNEIEYGFSAVSGDFYIEEKIDPDGDVEDSDITAESTKDDEMTMHRRATRSLYRRLIFVRNQSFVQTECRLNPAVTFAAGAIDSAVSKSKLKRLKKKLSQQNKSLTSANVEGIEGISNDNLALTSPWDPYSSHSFDFHYLDDHHAAVLVAIGSLCPPRLLRSLDDVSTSCLVCGFGGGSFTMALQRYAPSVAVVACDLDDRMEELATRFFGFVKAPTTNVIFCDGVELIKQYASGAVIDPLSGKLSIIFVILRLLPFLISVFRCRSEI